MSHLLISEPPLQLLPSLAVAVGLNEAVVLQQLHFKLTTSDVVHTYEDAEGTLRRWYYNTIDDWTDAFPFWSARTIRRTFQALRNLGLVIAEKHDASQGNHRLYYTIRYEDLAKYHTRAFGHIGPFDVDRLTRSGSGQNDHIPHSAKLAQSYTKNTSKNTKESSATRTLARAREQDSRKFSWEDLDPSAPMPLNLAKKYARARGLPFNETGKDGAFGITGTYEDNPKKPKYLLRKEYRAGHPAK